MQQVLIYAHALGKVAKKEERKGINPRTKEAITIPARKTIKFKAGSELNDKVK